MCCATSAYLAWSAVTQRIGTFVTVAECGSVDTKRQATAEMGYPSNVGEGDDKSLTREHFPNSCQQVKFWVLENPEPGSNGPRTVTD